MMNKLQAIICTTGDPIHWGIIPCNSYNREIIYVTLRITLVEYMEQQAVHDESANLDILIWFLMTNTDGYRPIFIMTVFSCGQIFHVMSN